MWFIGGAPQLSADARRLIEDGANRRYLGIASAWEIAIKVGTGKLDVRMPLAALWDQIPGNGSTSRSIAIERLSRCRRTAVAPPRPLRPAPDRAGAGRAVADRQRRRALRRLSDHTTLVMCPGSIHVQGSEGASRVASGPPPVVARQGGSGPAARLVPSATDRARQNSAAGRPTRTRSTLNRPWDT